MGWLAVLSQVIHCLSESLVALTMIGAPQFIASAERLTPTRSVAEAINREATIHTPCAWSKTTEGSLAATYVPPTATVRPGRKPFVQLAPPLVEVAKPMSDPPPLNLRPAWKAVMIVEPEANMPGSTSVACWLSELVKGSVLKRVIANCCGGGGGEGSEGVTLRRRHRIRQDTTGQTPRAQRLGTLCRRRSFGWSVSQ